MRSSGALLATAGLTSQSLLLPVDPNPQFVAVAVEMCAPVILAYD
jgi:hypothetical protein